MALRTSSNVSHGLFFVGLDDVTVFDIVRCIIAFCAQQCVTVKIFMLCLIVKKKKEKKRKSRKYLVRFVCLVCWSLQSIGNFSENSTQAAL